MYLHKFRETLEWKWQSLTTECGYVCRIRWQGKQVCSYVSKTNIFLAGILLTLSKNINSQRSEYWELQRGQKTFLFASWKHIFTLCKKLIVMMTYCPSWFNLTWVLEKYLVLLFVSVQYHLNGWMNEWCCGNNWILHKATESRRVGVHRYWQLSLREAAATSFLPESTGGAVPTCEEMTI